MKAADSEIMTRAASLASDLNACAVERNLLLSLTADFLTSPTPDPEKLKRLLQLLKSGNGGHLKRGKDYADCARSAMDLIKKLLNEGRDPFELKSILGWAARMLVSKKKGRN